MYCLEQIKIGAAYHKAPLIIIGTGSGLSYSELGATHHSLDDIAVLRSIPDLQILAPCDSNELKAFLRQALKQSIPTYIRIGKKGEPLITKSSSRPKIGEANILRDGNENIIFGIGPILNEALIADKESKTSKSNNCIVSMGSVKPLDTDFLSKMISRKFKRWIILEEHSIIGGLGSAIIEWKTKNNLITPQIFLVGAPDKFIHNIGKQSYVRSEIQIDKNHIKKII